jgi:hypothetical protein
MTVKHVKLEIDISGLDCLTNDVPKLAQLCASVIGGMLPWHPEFKWKRSEAADISVEILEP